MEGVIGQFFLVIMYSKACYLHAFRITKLFFLVGDQSVLWGILDPQWFFPLDLWPSLGISHKSTRKKPDPYTVAQSTDLDKRYVSHIKGAMSRFVHLEKLSLNFSSLLFAILIPLMFIIISLEFFYLKKLLFSGFFATQNSTCLNSFKVKEHYYIGRYKIQSISYASKRVNNKHWKHCIPVNRILH